jgi:hypothetical protein
MKRLHYKLRLELLEDLGAAAIAGLEAALAE